MCTLENRIFERDPYQCNFNLKISSFNKNEFVRHVTSFWDHFKPIIENTHVESDLFKREGAELISTN